jgi:hypothetical protein
MRCDSSRESTLSLPKGTGRMLFLGLDAFGPLGWGEFSVPYQCPMIGVPQDVICSLLYTSPLS